VDFYGFEIWQENSAKLAELERIWTHEASIQNHSTLRNITNVINDAAVKRMPAISQRETA